MYPTTIAGLLLVIAAIQYARQPDRRRIGIVRTLSVLTFLVSCLGFVTGLIKSFTAVANVDPHDVGTCVVMGVGESLNNIGLGLALLIVAAIATAIGRLRAGTSADLTDPHVP
jgi:hypothetical protein